MGMMPTPVVASEGPTECPPISPAAITGTSCLDIVPAIAIDAGLKHVCALLANGNVDCWGNNVVGQAVDRLMGDAVAIATGDSHTCILLTSGNVECHGVYGLTAAANYVGGDAVGVAAGEFGTCVVTAKGHVACNERRNGADSSRYDSHYVGGDAVDVAVGDTGICVLTSGGTVECQKTTWSPHDLADYEGGDAVAVVMELYGPCVTLTSGIVRCYEPSYGDWPKAFRSDGTFVRDTRDRIDCTLFVTGTFECLEDGVDPWNENSLSGVVGIAMGDHFVCALLESGDVDCVGHGPADRLVTRLAPLPQRDHVLLNEVHYDPTGNENVGEWVELLNPSTSSVSLSGWQLWNDGTNPEQAEGVCHLEGDLGPGEIRTIDVSACGMRLANTGDDLTLVNMLGRIVDQVWWADGGDLGAPNAAAATTEGTSIGRCFSNDTDRPTDDFRPTASSPGAPNACGSWSA